MNKMLLVDGSNLLHRAFHAFEGLKARDGTPSGAIYGTLVMLEAALRGGYTHVLFAVDHKAPTFRHKMYKPYKANRKPTDDSLRPQIPVIQEMVKAMGIPMACVKGVEADDVIGTLAVAHSPTMHVTIMTSDKDFNQLVGKNITIYNPMKKINIDPAKVKELYGITASQFTDYLALLGDKVDNIPGVDGCGEKMALDILTKYKTLDKALAHQKKLTPRQLKLLTEQSKELAICRKLVAMKLDVKGLPTLKQLKPKSADVQTLQRIKDAYSIRSKKGKRTVAQTNTPRKGLFG